MQRYRRFIVSLLLLLAVYALGAPPARAGMPRASSTIISDSVAQTIHGNVQSLGLNGAGRERWNTQVFFGLDSRSNAADQYLTSGLTWRAGSPDATTLGLTALHTQSRGTDLGGQTLLRAGNRIDLGRHWLLPDITAEMAQVTRRAPGADALGGRAMRLGLADALGPAQLSLGYFEADPQFDAWGSSLAPGDRGLALDTQLALGGDWQLTHDLRVNRANPLRDFTTMEQGWVVSRAPQPFDLGRSWEIRAHLGNADADSDDAQASTPVALELAAQSVRWRAWRLDSALGWYDTSARTPQGLPVAGGLWQASVSRALALGGWRTRLSPRLSLGGSRQQGFALASRAGLAVGLASLSDRINMSFDYLSAGWSATPSRGGDVQMRLNYSQDTGGILSSLTAAIQRVPVPWQRRR